MIPIVVCILGRTASAGVELTPDEAERLVRGELVKHKVPFDEENSVVCGTSFVVIDAPVDEVWALMHEVSSWPSVFSHIYDSRVQFQRGEARAVKLKVGLPVFNVNAWAIMVSDPEKHEIVTRLNDKKPNYAEEFFSRLQMIPQSGDRTLIVYTFKLRVSFSPVVALLGKTIIGKVEWVFLDVPRKLKKAAEGRRSRLTEKQQKTSTSAQQSSTR